MEKQRWEESGRRSQEVRRSEKRKSGKQEDAGARQGRKVAVHCVFPMIWGSGGTKSNLAKVAGAEPAGQVEMYKKHHSQTTFGSCDVEKVHAVVVRSTFVSKNGKSTSRSDHSSQNVQNTRGTDHFLTFRCRKSARRCGAKHISKSKV